MRDYYRDERQDRVVAMQPRRESRTRTLVAVAALLLLSQVIWWLFVVAAL